MPKQSKAELLVNQILRLVGSASILSLEQVSAYHNLMFEVQLYEQRHGGDFPQEQWKRLQDALRSHKDDNVRSMFQIVARRRAGARPEPNAPSASQETLAERPALRPALQRAADFYLSELVSRLSRYGDRSEIFNDINALIAAGARADWRVVNEAIGRELPEVVELFVKAGAAELNTHGGGKHVKTPLITAIENGKAGLVELFLEAGADPNLCDGEGTPPLVHTVSTFKFKDKDEQSVLSLLLAHGAKVDGRDRKGRTAFLVAAQYSSKHDILELLLDSGADARAVDSEGCNALMLAVEFALWDIGATVKLLVDLGLDVNAQNDRGETALIRAMAPDNPRPEQIKQLLELGADPNLAMKGGKTPLMVAVAGHNYKVIEALIAAGTHLDAQDEEGRTPLMYAASVKYGSGLASLLLKAGADPRITDNKGHTARDNVVPYGFDTERTISLLARHAEQAGAHEAMVSKNSPKRPGPAGAGSRKGGRTIKR